MNLCPTDVRPVGAHEILITWNGSTRQLFSLRQLRLLCPCAGCVDEMTGKRVVTLDKVSPEIRLLESKPVGRYALQFRWSDGHSTGIYSYTYLQTLATQPLDL